MKYTNEYFEITYPSTWSNKVDGKILILTSPLKSKNDAFRENLTLFNFENKGYYKSINSFKSKVLTDLLKSEVKNVKTLEDYNVKELVISSIVYTEPFYGNLIKQSFFLKNDNIYVFTLTSKKHEFNEMDKLTTEIINSIKIF